jgi:cytochrome c551/c552
MDATAMVDYFQPLLVWLERQNQGKPIGWGTARTDAAPPAGAPAPAAPAPTPAPAPTLTPTPAPAPPATGSPFRVDPTLATRGKTVWSKNGCGGCHGIGKKMAGPDLANIAARRSREWLHRWMKNTKQMLESDSIGRALLAEWKGMRMPQFNLSDADIDALLHYITQESEKAGVQR